MSNPNAPAPQAPPAGQMLTFLFTDIEGSTGLWEQHPEAMKLALARHDVLLRQAIEAHAGHVFKTVGDSFYAAFTNAADAVSAALDAQRALCRGDLYGRPDFEGNGDHKGRPDDGLIIRVRMGLHSGPAEQRDNDYFGPTLNRVARLMSAGYGGQMLLSAATRELVQNNLPPGAELRDMGERSLKDLIRPEHIYQLTVPGLPADFPPLKTLEVFRTNLPVQLTSFIGREKEIATVKSLMSAYRLTTLTGSGGTGKTRLSLQVAADLLDSFADGVWFVEFAPLSDPALVPQTVLNTLGLREEAGRSIVEALSQYLKTKKVLLILDNCEHVINAAAQLAETLLHTSQNLRLLVSSREALGIPGEKTHHVRSLTSPKTDALPSVENAGQYEAITLFADRAKIASSTFAIMPENIRTVVKICTRLDGIPLAIELAAARTKLLNVEQIAERLDDRFRLLTGGSRTAVPRQQTLRAMIDWSYDLLSITERRLLLQLSTFAGGWTLEAAEKVGSDEQLSDFDILDLLMQLVNKSLVLADANEGITNAETRYRMLETIRQYAREKLFESGFGKQARDRHLQYFTQLAERAEPEFTRQNQSIWMNRLDAELDNIRASLEWSLEQDVERGLRLANALRWFWVTHDHVRDGIEYLSQLLARPEALARTALRARSLATLSELIIEMNDSDLPHKLAQESLSIHQELGDKAGEADSLLALADSYFQPNLIKAREYIEESLKYYETSNDKAGLARALGMRGGFMDNADYARARSSLEQSLKICREIGHIAGIGANLLDLGVRAVRHGEYELAQGWLNEALEINRSLGKARTAETLISMGDMALQQGQYEQASVYFQEGLAISRELGRTSSIPWVLIRFGNLAVKSGDAARAKDFFKESYQQFKEDDNPIGQICSVEGFASIAVLQNQHLHAVKMLAIADVMRKRIEDSRPTSEQVDVDRMLATSRAHLDEASFTAAQEAGRTMRLDDAIALTLDETDN